MDERKKVKQEDLNPGEQGRASFSTGSTVQGGSNYGQGSSQLSGEAYRQGDKASAGSNYSNEANRIGSAGVSDQNTQQKPVSDTTRQEGTEYNREAQGKGDTDPTQSTPHHQNDTTIERKDTAQEQDINLNSGTDHRTATKNSGGSQDADNQL